MAFSLCECKPSPAFNGVGRSSTFSQTPYGSISIPRLGWAPEGRVFFQYSVSAISDAFSAEAAADLDANATPQIWAYLHPDSQGNTAPNVLGCAGVYDPQTGNSDRTSILGPCAAVFAQSEF